MTDATPNPDYLAEWGLTVEDDDLHPPVDDDPWWTETVWFSWFVPERNLVGYFYPMFRPNLGVQAGGVLVFDDTAELPWELPVFDYSWHQTIPDGLDLRDATLHNGMSLRCLEPGRRWHIGFENRDVSFEFDVEAVTRPMVSRATPPFNKGHIDQLCRVQGEMVLAGETIAVDHISMRDRSWGPRQDGRQPTVGYDYGVADPDNAFLAVAIGDRTPEWTVSTGFLLRDGVWSELTAGERRVERDAQSRPVTVLIEAEDQLGRHLSARGEYRSRQVFTAYPSMFCWNGLFHWEADGWQGYGEDQDVWHPRRWKRFLAQQRNETAGTGDPS